MVGVYQKENVEKKVTELTKDLESSDGERKSLKQENKGLLIETTKQSEKVQFQQMQIMQLTDKITVSLSTDQWTNS